MSSSERTSVDHFISKLVLNVELLSVDHFIHLIEFEPLTLRLKVLTIDCSMFTNDLALKSYAFISCSNFFFTSFTLLSRLAWLRNMNTCKKTNHYYYFLFIQRYRTSYSEGTATPPYLSYFCKKNTFSLIFQYSRFSRIFSYFFDDFSKSHRYAAT